MTFRTLLVVLFALFTFNNAYALAGCKKPHYMAVVDAGSTGSRLHLYTYDLDEYQDPTHVEEIASHTVNPGLSSIAANQADIDKYLSKLFSDVSMQDIPVYFYSTAGMRILSQQKQAIYYEALKNWFARQESFNLIDAKTIAGEDEAIFGWLSVNYNLGTLSDPKQKAVGVVDIGGASTQIVFPVDASPDSDQVTIKWHGQDITLFAHSFLGLGQNKAMEKFLNTPACFSQGYGLPEGLFGAGDATECEKNISSVVNGEYGVNALVSPRVNERSSSLSWYAIGAVPYLLHDGFLKINDESYSSAWLFNEVDTKACQVSWQNLKENDSTNGQLFSACFRASYYYALIVDGYGVSPEELIHVFPKEKNIDWALGVVLHQP